MLFVENATWIWFGLGILLLALELMMPITHFLWLGIAALSTAGVLAVSPAMPIGYQLIIFAVLAVISLKVTKIFFANRGHSDQPDLNEKSQQYIGRTATLATPIENGSGKLSIDDTQWLARGPDLPVGTKVRIIGLEGATFIVETVNN